MAAGSTGWGFFAGESGAKLARFRPVETFHSVAGACMLGISVSGWTDLKFLPAAESVTSLGKDSSLAIEMNLARRGYAEG